MSGPPISDYDHLPHVHEVLGKKPPEKIVSPPRTPRRPYAELRAASAFSFLDGASLPEDLIAQAAANDVPAMALIDTNGVYGAPRFFMAAKKAGVKALIGAELILEGDLDSHGRSEEEKERRKGGINTHHAGCRTRDEERSTHDDERNTQDSALSTQDSTARRTRDTGRGTRHSALGTDQPRSTQDGERNTQDSALRTQGSTLSTRLTVLVESREGYKNLCRLITAGAKEHPKGKARFTWELIEQHAAGLRCLTGGDEGPLAHALQKGTGGEILHRISGIFPGRTHVELQRHFRRDEAHRNHALVEMARRMRLPLVATNGVRYAGADGKELHDILTCIREGRNVDTAGQLLGINRERHIKSADAMFALFPDLPEAVDGAWELANTLDFTLANLGYQFPDYPLPAGESPISFLRQITWNAAMARFRPLKQRAQRQIEKELAMIERLDLAGYFLIVWDIVQFCRRENILVQGRGSAANSAVCYALSITAVDPVKMDLLFERFLSEQRGEWPDIDLDLPSGDQRERVIQHVYQTYGVHGAAMTANVITYRDRSAAREVAKSLGFSLEQADKLSKTVGTWNFGEIRERIESMPAQLAAAGFDPTDERVRHFIRLQMQIQNLPRHLGQHSGGMVMARGRLDEVVPLEPASMPGRVVIQWDKEDCADLGIIKVDLLGLGMLAALEEAIPLIKRCEGIDVDLAHLPENDPIVYKMLNEADTIGMFQVESRAQMASLPRNAPTCFYDIVVQVAIIRPGPIVGGMIKPFFDRRQKKAPIEYPHPCLEPILKRTLGVPLFQEQLLRMAMVAANFTGGEAEELRRAMGFKRSMERMHDIEKRLRDGMTKNGIDAAAQEQIVKSITSFALYGFPESHAASFALIAYASAYIKARHPAAFYISLLNAWPMGFYHPATLIKDAQRHGVKVLPVDVNHSGWMCRWESGGVRMGLRFVKGLRETAGRTIEAAQGITGVAGSSRSPEATDLPFTSPDDLARRARLRDDQMTKLAYAGAMASFGMTRRAALWQAALAAKDAGELFADARAPLAASGSPLQDLSRGEETIADYDSMQLTTGPHLLEHFRDQLQRDGIVSAAGLKKLPNGRRVTTAGAVIVRQRPGTAKGFVFLTLEDETGLSQAIVHPDLFREYRALIVGAPGLIVEGKLQNLEGQPSVRAERFWPLEGLTEVSSHDFH